MSRSFFPATKETKPASNARGGTKSSSTMAKVALMKLKMHAVGDKGIPDSERVYFSVQLPQSVSSSSAVAMFFSKVSKIKFHTIHTAVVALEHK